MTPESSSFLVILSIILLCGAHAKPPGWAPTPWEVEKPATFAVAKHNSETKSQLVYQKVVSKDYMRFYKGANLYRLVIAAKDGNADGMYKAYVLQDGSIQMLSFFDKLDA